MISSKQLVLAGSLVLIGGACAYFAMNPASAPSRAASTANRGDLPEEAGTANLLAELRSLTERGDALDFQALQEAIQSLVRTDPKAAADFATSLPEGPIREISLHRVAQAWAGRNAGAAAQWADSFRNQEERGALLNGIFCEVAQADPAKAVQMAETHDMLSFSPAMTGNLIQQWAMRDHGAALGWAEGQPSGPLRDQVFLRLALVRSETSPEEAAGMISEHISPGAIQEEAAISIVSRWAASDPEAAKAWANTFAAGEFRERALSEITLATSPGS